MSKPAARLTDMGSGHGSYPPTPIMSASPNVLINGRAAARMGDALVPHTKPKRSPHPRSIAAGSATVTINGQPAARVGDPIDCGGVIMKGSPNVLIGDKPAQTNPVEPAEWDAFMERLREAGPQARFNPEQRQQIAADTAVEFRGEAGGVASWQAYFGGMLSAGRTAPHANALGDSRAKRGLRRAKDDHVARMDALTAAGVDPVRPEPSDLARYWQCCQRQIAAAREDMGAMPPGPERDALQAATDRFERNNTALHHARLAKDTYDPSRGPPEGWFNIGDDPDALAELDLERKNLRMQGSNFGAEAYAPDVEIFGHDMDPVVAFKGTQQPVFDGLRLTEDWANNFNQGLNLEAPYYEQAVQVGRRTKRSGQEITFVGHSLGGGMASAASRASRKSAMTFNSAGLHPKTVERYGGSPSQPERESIQALRVEGELLTRTQEPGVMERLIGGAIGSGIGSLLGQSAVGGAVGAVALDAIPGAIGEPHDLPGKGSALDRHGIDQVIESIGEQKAEDQAVIAEATGVHCSRSSE